MSDDRSLGLAVRIFAYYLLLGAFESLLIVLFIASLELVLYQASRSRSSAKVPTRR